MAGWIPASDAEILQSLRKKVEILERENTSLSASLADAHSKRLEEKVGTLPSYITEGSFGKISTLPLQPFVYKTTILGDKANGEKLKHESTIYNDVYNIINGALEALRPSQRQATFISPAPLELFDPFTRTVTVPDMTTSSFSSSWDVFDHPTMSIECIPSVPPLVGLAFRSEFFTSEPIRKTPTFSSRLLRFYLGRKLPVVIEELQPGLRSDLALDVLRYTRLLEALTLEGIATLPPLTDVAFGMGKVLAQLHFGVGIDGMDVELVMGGDGRHGLQCYILDYNQCQRWLIRQPFDNLDEGKLTTGEANLSEGAIQLARRIGNCEHYYPKSSQELYCSFKKGYQHAVTELVSVCEPGEISEVRKMNAQAILAASEAFLLEYEEVGRGTVERKARTRSRVEMVIEHDM